MLPAVTVHQFVPRGAGVFNADNETPLGRAVSAATNDRAGRKLATNSQAAPSHLAFARQHSLESIGPPYELRRRFKISLTCEATAPFRDAKIRRPRARSWRH
jgi:hypothetical protein